MTTANNRSDFKVGPSLSFNRKCLVVIFNTRKRVLLLTTGNSNTKFLAKYFNLEEIKRQKFCLNFKEAPLLLVTRTCYTVFSLLLCFYPEVLYCSISSS